MTEPGPLRYCLDDMLTIEQLCQRLPQTTPGIVYRWQGCPRYRTGKRNLYMWGEVLTYLRNRTPPTQDGAAAVPRRAAGPVGEVFSMPHRTGAQADSLSPPGRGTFTPPPPLVEAQRRDREAARGATTPPKDAA